MKFFVLILLFIFTTTLQAKSHEARMRFTDTDGESITIGLTAYKNKFGELEVRVDAAGMPKLLDRLNPVIAYGRDLNDNNKIDTWFILTSRGIETEQIEGNDYLGRDVLPKLLFKKHPSSARLYFTTATTTLLSFFLLTAKESTDKEAEFVKDWINLDEMRLRLEREMQSETNTLTRDQIQYQYALISQGYKNLADDMEKFAKADFWKWAGADVGLWISGSFIFKSAATLLIKAGAYITETTVYLTFKEEISALVAKNIAVLKEKGAAIGSKFGMAREKSEQVAGTAIAHMSAFRVRTTVAAIITADIAKKRLSKVAAATIKWPLKIAAGARSEWQYITMSTGIQLAAETASHYSEVYDPNPLFMAKNILSNEDILQNIGFMTTDTILMTGLSKNISSTKTRFLVSGYIGLQNSALINLVIKNEDNYKRVALDTAWESLIGNAQVQLDLKALETFEKISLKKNNPRLKLLGYAVVLINQGTGFFLYSKAAEKVKPAGQSQDTNTIKLIPVLAEN